ncbi:MFS transporter [Pseudomonas putida]
MNTRLTSERLDKADKRLVYTLASGAILPLLDTTMVNVAVGGIAEQLGASLKLAQWVIAAYALAAASAVPLSSWCVGKVGARQVWLYSLWLFLAGAMLSSAAQNIHMLIAARALQGIATGLLLPTMQTIVMSSVSKGKAKTALAAIAIPSVLAPILGALTGGAILEALGWRTVFYLHLPFCLIAIVQGRRLIPMTAGHQPIHFDAQGFLMLCPAMALVILGITRLTGSMQSSVAPIGIIIAGLALFAMFVNHAMREPARALLDLTILRMNHIRRSCVLLFLSSVHYYGSLLLLPLYFAHVGNYSSGIVGLLLGLHGLGTLLARQYIAGQNARWCERTVVWAGTSAALCGSMIMAWPELVPTIPAMALGIFLRGAGVGILTLQAMSGAYVGLNSTHISHSSALTRMLTLLGGATGVAIVVVSLDWTATLNSFVPPHIALIVVTAMCCLAAPKSRASH